MTRHLALIFVVLFLLSLLPLLPQRTRAEDGSNALLQVRGLIIAKHQPVISSELAGRINTIFFRPGEYFKKGDTLISLDRRLLSAQRDKAEAALEGAELKLENSKQLKRLKSIGELEVSLAEVEVKSRKAEVAMARIALERCLIKAPFKGRVVSLEVEEHESIAPNQNLLELVSTEQLLVEVLGPADWLGWLKVGQKFVVSIDLFSEELEAEIITIGAVVDPVSNMVTLHGRMSKQTSSLLPGMMVSATFVPERQTLKD